MLCPQRRLPLVLACFILPMASFAANPGDRLDLRLRDGRTLENVEVLKDEGDSMWVMAGKTLTALKKRDIISENAVVTEMPPAPIADPEQLPPETAIQPSPIPAQTPNPVEESSTKEGRAVVPASANAPEAPIQKATMANPALLGGLLLALVAIAWLWQSSRTARKRLDELENRYKPVIDLDKAIRERQSFLDKAAISSSEKEKELLQLNADLVSMKKTLALFESEGDMVACGHYKPQFSFTVSEEYKAAITAIRERQRAMIKDETAATCPQDWTVNGSVAEGKKATKRTLRLLLRAFNGECDAIIAAVSWSNIDRMQDRMRSAFDGINKLGASYHCSLSYDYLTLKLKELGLTFEYEAKLQKEKEEQRALREQMRDEEKARREMEEMLKQATRDEEKAKEALAKAREEVAKTSGEKEAALNSKISLLEEKLREALANKERALSRAQLTRSGHVYIISNIGSFGETVFKIGMTRRLDPFERVYELGDASVPFEFDVHGMIYTEDAPALEARLHNYFDRKRVNLVNSRKEFFHTTIDEIQNAVHSQGAEVILTKLAEAREYRETLDRKRAEEDSAAVQAG